MSGIWWMNATIGVTNAGPMIGRYCKPSSGAVCGMATSGVTVVARRRPSGTSAAGSASADVVTRSAALVSAGVRPNSCRAAAIIIHGNGDSTGAVGELPANGFRTALTTLDIAVVTTATGACGGVDTTASASRRSPRPAPPTGWPLAVGPRRRVVHRLVFVDSVASDGTVRAVALPALPSSTRRLLGGAARLL